ncbi:polyprenyl synthetase family protein [Candidatus Puniceispirillum sp.]|uniref:polyprenyl synthetase family protein n=1 Tax=Candidatus Puniceispirillum sp. TaxID=2026719 RepID=UPI001EC0D2CA|nr:geranylgeranyl pyrophosphate synthase [Candidatus Puniceispirillum sp.]
MTVLSVKHNPMLRDVYSRRNADSANAQILHDFIVNRLPKDGTQLADAARHHFAKPGKMLRAKMALSAATLLKIDQAAALHWSTAIEVLHNASLIHDDICDGDKMRRGRVAVWAKYGRDVALTLGDWLIALAFELAAEAAQRSNTPMLVKILAKHMATTTAGEAAEFSIQSSYSWNNYLRIAGDKTAPLLTAPLEGIAAMALHGDTAGTIGAYFRHLGEAYQIANDILNFCAGDGAEDCGSDLARRAPNAVIVLYREHIDANEAVAFDAWCKEGSNDSLMFWLQKIVASDALIQSAGRMQNILDESKRCAAEMPVELQTAIAPVQALLEAVCHESVAGLAH